MPWSCLETLYTLSQPLAVWRQLLGPHFVPFQQAFLEPDGRLVSSYPCPRQCGCDHEVICHGAGDVVAACRCDPWCCEDLALQAADLECFRLSWARLGRALCRCWSLDSRPAELGLARARQIGSWSSAAVPVFLVIEPSAHRFRCDLIEIVSRLQKPFILQAPTSRQITAPDWELLGRVGAGFFDLETHVTLLPSGMLLCRKAPGDLFRAQTPQPKQEDQGVVERAFALVKALETETTLQRPGPLAVFSEFCISGLNVSQVARKFRCSRGTILNRLALIRRRTGMEPDAFRKISPHIAQLQAQCSDPRASRIRQRAMLEQEDDQEE
jgi:hypothetical protein